MTWELSEKEFVSVTALPDLERYRHFISRVVDTEMIWGLRSRDGDWAYATGEDGTEVVAVWPHERYAQACATGPWADDEPTSISIDDWRAKWLPGLERDGHEIAVFPTPASTGVQLTPQRLGKDLREGLEQY